MVNCRHVCDVRERASTFSSPGAERAVAVYDVVEGERDDEEGAVAGRVHLKGHVALVQPHGLALLGQGRLKQLPRHLGAAQSHNRSSL